MEKLLSRRDFIAAGAGGATVVAVEGIAANPTSREIIADVLPDLQERAKALTPSITSLWFENPRLSAATFNREATAESLLMLAYIDGGEERVEQVASYIDKQKLYVYVAKDIPTVGGVMHPPDVLRPVFVKLNSGIMERYAQAVVLAAKNPNGDNQRRLYYQEGIDEIDKLNLHEFAHVIQLARDPENFARNFKLGSVIAPLAIGIPGCLILNDLIQRGITTPLKDKEPENGRRVLLLQLLHNAALIALAYSGLGPFLRQNQHSLSIFEKQAESYAVRLFNSPAFDHLRGKFFLPKQGNIA